MWYLATNKTEPYEPDYLNSMMTIPLSQAVDILQCASAVIIDDEAVTFPSIDSLTGDADHEFLFIRWSNDDGYEFSERFTEGVNANIIVEGSQLCIRDDEGELVKITILVPADISTCR